MMSGTLSVGFTAAVAMVLFVVLSYMRQGERHLGIEHEVFRYLFPSYNAEALILDGSLKFSGHGTLYYWSKWMWNFPILNEMLPLESIRQSMFGAAPEAGAIARGPILARVGITTTTALPSFACSFIDLGWFGFLPYAIVGVLCAKAWVSFTNHQLPGMLFYPIIAYSFLEWRANLEFPHVTLGYAIILYIFLVIMMSADKKLTFRRPSPPGKLANTAVHEAEILRAANRRVP